MDPEQWRVLFNCFVVGGFVIPVLNVLVGVIGGGMDLDADVDVDVDADLDLDADVDVDVDADLDLDTDLDVGADAAPHVHSRLPVNLMSLSLAAVIFGAVGRLLMERLPILWSVVLSVQAAVFGAFLLGWFVLRPLKRNRAYAANIRSLRGRTGTVQLELRSDFVGTIRVLSATGSLVTYSARPAEGIARIAVGEEVSIVDVDADKAVCTVRPLEKRIENGEVNTCRTSSQSVSSSPPSSSS